MQTLAFVRWYAQDSGDWWLDRFADTRTMPWFDFIPVQGIEGRFLPAYEVDSLTLALGISRMRRHHRAEGLCLVCTLEEWFE